VIVIWTVLLDVYDLLHCKWLRSPPQSEDRGSDISVWNADKHLPVCKMSSRKPQTKTDRFPY